jgi:putative membrane protein
MAKYSEIAIEKSMRLIAKVVAAGRLKTIASGVEHLPDRGPILIVARHYHHLYDGVALAAAIPRPFHILVTLDWLRSRGGKLLMGALTTVARWPVILRADAVALAEGGGASVFSSRDVVHYQRNALRQAVDILVEGRILVIFPEGYPNIDPTYTPKTRPDEFLPFKPGFVTITVAAEKRLKREIPIIPAGLRYTPAKPWVAHLKFGKANYRKNFVDSLKLVANLETSVRELSAVERGILKGNALG